MTPSEFKKSRQGAGFSQRELAKMLGISDRTVRRIEAGSWPISPVIEHKIMELNLEKRGIK